MPNLEKITHHTKPSEDMTSGNKFSDPAENFGELLNVNHEFMHEILIPDLTKKHGC